MIFCLITSANVFSQTLEKMSQINVESDQGTTVLEFLQVEDGPVVLGIDSPLSDEAPLIAQGCALKTFLRHAPADEPVPVALIEDCRDEIPGLDPDRNYIAADVREEFDLGREAFLLERQPVRQSASCSKATHDQQYKQLKKDVAFQSKKQVCTESCKLYLAWDARGCQQGGQLNANCSCTEFDQTGRTTRYCTDVGSVMQIAQYNGPYGQKCLSSSQDCRRVPNAVCEPDYKTRDKYSASGTYNLRFNHKSHMQAFVRNCGNKNLKIRWWVDKKNKLDFPTFGRTITVKPNRAYRLRLNAGSKNGRYRKWGFRYQVKGQKYNTSSAWLDLGGAPVNQCKVKI